MTWKSSYLKHYGESRKCFLQIYLPFPEQISIFKSNFIFFSANPFQSELFKDLFYDKE